MYPSLLLKNQFGEESNNFVLGGSNQIWCNFIVDIANGNGFGLRSLKQDPSNSIAAVYMHTSATAASGNPNPATGYIVVKFSKAFASYINGTSGFVAPSSGSNVNVTSGLTQYDVYIITSLGTTTAANWQALGLPANVAPAVDVAFVASTSSAGSGTGTVQLILATGSTVEHIEGVGDPNQTVITTDGNGGYLICIILGATNSTTTTLVAKQPADNTVIGLTFNLTPKAGPLI